MRRCSFNTNDTLNRFFTKYSVSKAGRNMRELLIVAPLNFPLVASVVVIVASSRSVLKSLLEIDLLSLR